MPQCKWIWGYSDRGSGGRGDVARHYSGYSSKSAYTHDLRFVYSKFIFSPKTPLEECENHAIRTALECEAKCSGG